MKRILLAAAVLLMPALARAQGEQALVDRSTIAFQEILSRPQSQSPRDLLPRARAALICPRVLKGGFIFAGAGGDCVLLARAGNGTWSYPAFYTIGELSFGLQAGLQDSALVMMVMNNAALGGILNSHFKIGADASVAVGPMGGGVEGALTTALGADLVTFSSARGAFIGISFDGSVLNARPAINQAYYGRAMDGRQIVISMLGSNAGADPLRAVLTRYGAPGAPAYPPPSAYAPPAYAPRTYPASTAQAYPPAYPPASGNAPTAPGMGAPIAQQNLPPPSH